MADAIRDALERIAKFPDPTGADCYVMRNIARGAIAQQPAQGEAVALAELGLEAGRTYVRGFINPWEGPNSRYTKPLYTTPPVPDGWKLVPVEPTDEMIRAIRWAGDPSAPSVEEIKRKDYDLPLPFVGGIVAARMHRAMLAAAPEPPR